MCGIAGVVNHDGRPVDPAVLLRMRDAMVHRGPDDAGLWLGDEAGLAHRRLSIFDLSPLGHQPMASKDATAWLVFNGEVFNFLELRQGLEAQGHCFATSSDTEVLLRLWQEQGESCLQDLVGMYGFAIWDRRTRSLFAARDRAGIKPFYYAEVPGTFLFASEIKALLAHPEVHARVDHAGFADYVYAGYALADRTLFAGIKQLPPGHFLRLEGGRATIRPYWSVQYRYAHNRDHAETAVELGSLLRDSVRLHCRSDAPLGSHLSGGLDSSSVATLASEFRDPLSTFSIKFTEGGVYDETRYSRAVGERIGARIHEEAPPSLDVSELLPFLVWHMEFPMGPGGFAYFSGARLARRHVTVSLTGHGGDEVFGGYPAQFDLAFGGGGLPVVADREGRQPRSMAHRLRAVMREEGPRGLVQRLRRRVAPVPQSAADQWIASHCTRPEPALDAKLAAAFRSELAGYSPRADFLTAFTDAPTDELFDRCLHHDLRTYLPSLLHIEDRASMAVSLESRVPLLDHRVIEFMATVPPDIKVPHRESKELLRTVMERRLPEVVTNRRDKAAFPAPMDAWFARGLQRYTTEILGSDRSRERGLFTAAWIDDTVATGTNWERWIALTVELWARLFLDEDRELLAQAQHTSRTLRTSLGLVE